MNDYDFTRLNDKEFEVLCSDLIGGINGVHFERFKPGRDGGVDGRYFSPSKKEWILQCKHWPTTPHSKLVAYIKNVEAKKVAKLNPEKYILVLSTPLSRENKTEIANIFNNLNNTDIEIYGREDLNDFLYENPNIERRHFKLWISSTNVLIDIINNAIIGRSDFMLQDIIAKSKSFVTTSNFNTALNTLEKLGVIIITGQAGIGKTTLAEQIILHYASAQFELVCISSEIQEAEQAYNPTKKQIFYFDDFLGQNYLQALTGHEGSQIIHFIKRVNRDNSNKKFVLTSRSTILNQGRILIDAFDNHNIDRNELEIKISSLKPIDKAHILYNHIWHSSLDPDYIDELYSNKRYRKIINHPNFNPRIISFITDLQRLSSVPAIEYWKHVIDLLDNPAKIWQHPFDSQLDDFGRAVVLLVAFNGTSFVERDLAIAYGQVLSMPFFSHMKGQRDFNITVRHLTNSMLTRVIIGGTALYRLFNPSLRDYLLHRISTEQPTLRALCLAIRSEDCVVVILDMLKNNFINKRDAITIISNLYQQEEDSHFETTPPEYISRICLALVEHSETTSKSQHYIAKTANIVLSSNCARSYENSAKVIVAAIDLGLTSPEKVKDYVSDAFKNSANSVELPLIGDLIYYLEHNGIHDLSERFADLAYDCLTDSIDDYFDVSDIVRDGFDLFNAKETLRNRIEEYLDEWGVSSFRDDVISNVTEHYNLERKIERHYEPREFYPRHYPSTQTNVETDGIDDLFERDQ